MRQKWAGQASRDGTVDRRAYELRVPDELRLVSRAGDVWATGSRKDKDLGAYLPPLSPLAREHIGLTGDHVWRPEGVPAEGTHRTPRE